MHRPHEPFLPGISQRSMQFQVTFGLSTMVRIGPVDCFLRLMQASHACAHHTAFVRGGHGAHSRAASPSPHLQRESQESRCRTRRGLAALEQRPGEGASIVKRETDASPNRRETGRSRVLKHAPSARGAIGLSMGLVKTQSKWGKATKVSFNVGSAHARYISVLDDSAVAAARRGMYTVWSSSVIALSSFCLHGASVPEEACFSFGQKYLRCSLNLLANLTASFSWMEKAPDDVVGLPSDRFRTERRRSTGEPRVFTLVWPRVNRHCGASSAGIYGRHAWCDDNLVAITADLFLR